MHFSTRFTVAVHTLLCIEYFKDEKNTSEFIASSVGVNPVVIRRVLGQLKKAGFISTDSPKSGAKLAKALSSINLYEVFCAVEDERSLFTFHDNPEPKCPVGAHIHDALDLVLFDLDETLKNRLSSYKLSDLMTSLNFSIKKEKNQNRHSKQTLYKGLPVVRT